MLAAVAEPQAPQKAAKTAPGDQKPPRFARFRAPSCLPPQIPPTLPGHSDAAKCRRDTATSGSSPPSGALSMPQPGCRRLPRRRGQKVARSGENLKNHLLLAKYPFFDPPETGRNRRNPPENLPPAARNDQKTAIAAAADPLDAVRVPRKQHPAPRCRASSRKVPGSSLEPHRA